MTILKDIFLRIFLSSSSSKDISIRYMLLASPTKDIALRCVLRPFYDEYIVLIPGNIPLYSNLLQH